MSPAYGADRAGFRDWMGLHETLSTALVTGAVGSAAMMAVAMLGAATLDLPPLHPAIVLGESFVGPEAIEAVAGKVAFGLLVHLATSIGLAFIVCAILPRDFPLASAMGVGVGLTLLAFMFVLMPLVVPWANPGFRSGMQGMGGTWIVALAIFGAVVGGGPALRRWAAREGAKGKRIGNLTRERRPGTLPAAVRKA